MTWTLLRQLSKILPMFCWASLEAFTLFHIKMHVSEYACKICHKQLAIFLKCWESFKWSLQSMTCTLHVTAWNVMKVLLAQKHFPFIFKDQVYSGIFQVYSTLQWQPSGNVTKLVAVAHQYEQCDGILVCNSIWQ